MNRETMKLENEKVRRIVYYILMLATLVLGTISVFCASTDAYVLPDWVNPATTAVNYIVAFFFGVAASNTPNSGSSTTEESEVESEPASNTHNSGLSIMEEPEAEPEPGTVPARFLGE